MAEKEIYRYTIHKVALRKGKPLKKGELRAKDITVIVKRIQRGIKKVVCKRHIPLLVYVYNINDKKDHFRKQYDDKHDFKGFRKPAKWRKALTRKAKFSRTFDPSPKQWFVQVAKKKQLIFCLSQVFQHQIKLQMYPDEVLVLMLYFAPSMFRTFISPTTPILAAL